MLDNRNENLHMLVFLPVATPRLISTCRGSAQYQRYKRHIDFDGLAVQTLHKPQLCKLNEISSHAKYSAAPIQQFR